MTHKSFDLIEQWGSCPDFIEVIENGGRFFYFSRPRQSLYHKNVKKSLSEGSFLSSWVTLPLQKGFKKVLSNV